MLSVITPVFPAQAEHLPETAETVRATSDLLELEWILVVDGPGPVPELPSGMPEVRIIRLPEWSGISAAHNAALAQARGDLILPLDADDLLVPEGLGEIETLELIIEDRMLVPDDTCEVEVAGQLLRARSDIRHQPRSSQEHRHLHKQTKGSKLFRQVRYSVALLD